MKKKELKKNLIENQSHILLNSFFSFVICHFCNFLSFVIFCHFCNFCNFCLFVSLLEGRGRQERGGRDVRGGDGMGWEGKLKCYIQTSDIQTLRRFTKTIKNAGYEKYMFGSIFYHFVLLFSSSAPTIN